MFRSVSTLLDAFGVYKRTKLFATLKMASITLDILA